MTLGELEPLHPQDWTVSALHDRLHLACKLFEEQSHMSPNAAEVDQFLARMRSEGLIP